MVWSSPSSATGDFRDLSVATFALLTDSLPSLSTDLTTSTALPCLVLTVFSPTPGRYRLSTEEVMQGTTLPLPPCLLAMGLTLRFSRDASLLLLVGATLSVAPPLGMSDARGEAVSELVTLLAWLREPRDLAVMLLLSGEASASLLRAGLTPADTRPSWAALLLAMSRIESTGPVAAPREESRAKRGEEARGGRISLPAARELILGPSTPSPSSTMLFRTSAGGRIGIGAVLGLAGAS